METDVNTSDRQIWKLASVSCSSAPNIQAWGQTLFALVMRVDKASHVSKDSLAGPSQCHWHPSHLQAVCSKACCSSSLLTVRSNPPALGSTCPCAPQEPTGFLQSRAGYLQPKKGFCPLHS